MTRHRRGRARVLLAAAFLLGSALLLSCQPAQPAATPKPAEKGAAATPAKAAEKPVKGGTLRYVALATGDSLDPHATSGTDWRLFDTLFYQTQELKATLDGGLVKDWSASPDGKALTLKLREGIKFHDGTDLDAAAVKFNIERVKDPATKSPYRADYAKVASIDAVDGLTVRLNLSAPDPLLVTAMGGKGGSQVSPAAVKKYGQDFGRNPVGTGPFRFTEWAMGSHITMKRFEGYWQKDKDGVQLPYLDQVVKVDIPDYAVAFSNLRTGQIDLFAQMSAEQLTILKGDPNLTYQTRAWTPVNGLYFNTVRPPFNNKALRQAVALALDRQGMAARFGEYATAHASILHPMMWAYDKQLGLFPERDLAKAKAKMAEAGYPSGGLKVTMPIESKEEAQTTAQILKANMAEIGIEADIQVLASAALTTRVRSEMNYEIAPYGSQGANLADPGYLWNQNFHSKGGRNYFGPYSNPQVDQLLEKANIIYDEKERTALYREVAKILADDMPFVPWYIVNNINGLSKKVRGYVLYPDNFQRFMNVWMAQ